MSWVCYGCWGLLDEGELVPRKAQVAGGHPSQNFEYTEWACPRCDSADDLYELNSETLKDIRAEARWSQNTLNRMGAIEILFQLAEMEI